MPSLHRIVVKDFRNIALQELTFSPKLNCITGDNGEGKTNLCDAIYCLSMTKSCSGVQDQFNVRYGSGGFALSGTYDMESGLVSTFSLSFTPDGGKRLRRDDKPLARISDHIGTLPVVMVSPYDSSLVSEGGERRRRFANAVLSQTDHEYLNAVQQYNRLLLQRNHLLKIGTADPVLLETFDSRMSSAADYIFRRRGEFAEEIVGPVREYYSEISGGREEIGIQYESDLLKGPLDSLLAGMRERDMMLGYTGVGVQRDDLVFSMNGHPIRKCGSQGQQKSFLVALKFAQYDIMRRRYGFAPTLLLDDLFDKLDMGRAANLLRLVGGDGFGQIFISDTKRDRLSGIVDSISGDKSYYLARGGVFERI